MTLLAWSALIATSPPMSCYISLSPSLFLQLTEGGVDYEYLRERHVTHNKSLHEIYSYLE